MDTCCTTIGGVRSGWGDLQISPKYLIYDDKKQLLSGGVGMIIPVGEKAPYHQFGNSAFVFQPYLLYLARPNERWVLQGGLEYDIPVANNLENVSLFRWLTFVGYQLYSDPQSRYDPDDLPPDRVPRRAHGRRLHPEHGQFHGRPPRQLLPEFPVRRGLRRAR